LDGTGSITINWGDGTQNATGTLSGSQTYTHSYSGSGARNITITGTITYLDCSGNQLTSLDVSGATSLTGLNCSGNPLTSLDVSGTALTRLNVEGMGLESLSVSGCTNMEELQCQENQLTSLDASGCTALQALYCHENRLTSLDVNGCTALRLLVCLDNQLTAFALDDLFGTLHSNPGTKTINVGGNPGSNGCNPSIATSKGWVVEGATGQEISVDDPAKLPTEYNLSQNYPNPFNPTTMIEYSLPEPARVVLSIYNSLGQEVAVPVNAHQAAGRYRIEFDAKNLPSGIYFYRLGAERFVSTKKMMLVK
jgi:Leucine-rich repeat (LRR) protein